MIQNLEFAMNCNVTDSSNGAKSYKIDTFSVTYNPPIGSRKAWGAPQEIDFPHILIHTIDDLVKNYNPVNDVIHISVKGKFMTTYFEWLKMIFDHYSKAKNVKVEYKSKEGEDYELA